MVNIVRHLHRLAGGSGAGSPAVVASSGAISINFDTGGTPELWASNGTAWQQLNPASSVAYATSAQIITGTVTNVAINPGVMAGASVLGISAGAGDASKYLRLDANGRIDASVFGLNAIAATAGVADAGKMIKADTAGLLDHSFLPKATSANVITGTAANSVLTPANLAGAATSTSSGAADANKYLRLDANGEVSPNVFGNFAVNTSGGGGDAGKLVKLDVNGQVATNMIDAATALEIQNNAGSGTVNGFVTDDKLAAASVKTFGATSDDGKLVRVTSTGKISPTLLPTSTMEFQGSIDPTAAANVPATPDTGDVYIISTAGTIDAGFTGAGGKTGAVGDQLIYDGTNWTLIQTANPDLSGYLPLAGTAGVTGAAMASGALVTFDPAASGNVVLYGSKAAGTYGALDRVEIDCGTF